MNAEMAYPVVQIIDGDEQNVRPVPIAGRGDAAKGAHNGDDENALNAFHGAISQGQRKMIRETLRTSL